MCSGGCGCEGVCVCVYFFFGTTGHVRDWDIATITQGSNMLCEIPNIDKQLESA